MARVRVKTIIKAPIDLVFDIVAHIDRYALAVPHVSEYEFLTEQTVGVGTRFLEVRNIGDRQTRTELDVTEYVENERVCTVSDVNGTIWSTQFSLKERQTSQGPETTLSVVLDAKAYQWGPRLVNLIVRKMFKSAIGNDMDLIRNYCERYER